MNPATIDADEDPEVETRPVRALATTIRTLGVAGQAPDPLQVRLALAPGQIIIYYIILNFCPYTWSEIIMIIIVLTPG